MSCLLIWSVSVDLSRITKLRFLKGLFFFFFPSNNVCLQGIIGFLDLLSWKSGFETIKIKVEILWNKRSPPSPVEFLPGSFDVGCCINCSEMEWRWRRKRVSAPAKPHPTERWETRKATPPTQGMWRCAQCRDRAVCPWASRTGPGGPCLAAHPGAEATELTGAGNKTKTQVSWLSYSGSSLTCFLLPVCKQHGMGLQRLKRKMSADGETKGSSTKR